MKLYMRRLIIFAAVLFSVGVIGRIAPWGSTNWNFVFENMIWFPIEVVITVMVIDKIIAERDAERDQRRFQKITRTANPNLILSLKNNLADLVVDNTVYDEHRDNKVVFQEILEHPSEFLTQQYFDSMRLFHFIDLKDQYYNHQGVSHYYCMKMSKTIQQYLDRYVAVIDDDVLDVLVQLQNALNGAGTLDYEVPSMWTNQQHWQLSDTLISSISNLFKLTNHLEQLFIKIEQASK